MAPPSSNAYRRLCHCCQVCPQQPSLASISLSIATGFIAHESIRAVRFEKRARSQASQQYSYLLSSHSPSRTSHSIEKNVMMFGPESKRFCAQQVKLTRRASCALHIHVSLGGEDLLMHTGLNGKWAAWAARKHRNHRA
jgi:hypothetical protein